MSGHNHLLPAVLPAAFFLLAGGRPAQARAPAGAAVGLQATATPAATIRPEGTG